MLRIGVLWPRPRKDRWQLGRTRPDEFPDLSDALLFLEGEGFRVDIEESLSRPWNPLARKHEFQSGLDPLRAARTIARSRRYDALVCIGDATSLFPFWLRRLRRRRLPIVLIDPALSYDYPRRKRLQDFVLPKAARVVVYGRCQLDYLREQYGDRVAATFIHHRVDTEFYRPEGPVGQPPGRPQLVFSIGNDYSRDYKTLAGALPLIAGAGVPSFRTRLQTTRDVPPLPEGVELCRNTVPYPDLRRLYNAADVVVITLRDMIHAGGINSLLEAMACGRPVVVSRSRGIADYVRDGETALVVEPESPAALAGAIARLLSNAAEAARLGANAREFVLEHCANRVYAHKLVGVLREAIHSPVTSKEQSAPATRVGDDSTRTGV
jgi:glycosyltransferase involved in cell wall biosynthesis